MIAPDDPRLTAYTVDEVDAETSAEVEQALSESEALREAAAEIESTARLLAAALAAEVAPELRFEQRQAIEDAATNAPSPGRRPWQPFELWASVAALLLLTVGLVLWHTPYAAPARQATAPAAPVEAMLPSGAPTTAPPAPGSPAPVRSPAASAVPRPPAARVTVTVRGVVKDESGAPLPGVTLTVQSTDTGATRDGRSGERGDFNLDGLPSGRLVVRAELPGFTASEHRVSAPPGAVVSLQPTLRIGTLAETITVEANAPIIQASVATSTSGRPRPDGDPRYAAVGPGFNTEAYAHRVDNAFVEVKAHPLSTFSLDVDTASYSNVRRFLLDDEKLPPPDAVRIEEMVNYFPYDYPAPKGKERFAAHLEVAPAPWKPEHRLLRIGLKTPEIDLHDPPPGNLVFLIDVSGSMEPANKLPLVRQSLRMLVERLTERDHVAIVVYAGAAGLVLPPTPGDQKPAILAAVERLEAGGSTNGGQGIELAYELASRNFIPRGVNRVILATDGDFNVGTTDEGSLVRLVQEKAKGGVFLSVLGFGMGNLKDATLETLADKGNGNYAYIDRPSEARKALVEQMAGTLVTVAKDVKIQVEFNPENVRAYRLIGYENRLLRPEDFKDDTKDAGEVGAGHTVTALYELVLTGRPWSGPTVDPLRYQSAPSLTAAARGRELLHLKLRYKEPEGRKSRLEEWTLVDRGATLNEASADFRFAAAVAAFGMILRASPDRGEATVETVLPLAEGARGSDPWGYRSEFVELVRKAQKLQRDVEDDAKRPR